MAQISKLARRLSQVQEILNKYPTEGTCQVTQEDMDDLQKIVKECQEAAGVIRVGHNAIAEVLNRL